MTPEIEKALLAAVREAFWRGDVMAVAVRPIIVAFLRALEPTGAMKKSAIIAPTDVLFGGLDDAANIWAAMRDALVKEIEDAETPPHP